MNKLNFADNLKLPIEAATETFCILAMRGKGKTHTASVFSEEFLKAGVPVVIYDPIGVWWGLKSSADGKRRAFPVAIFGGDHADVPLEERAGAMIARAIVKNRYAAILDVSRLSKGKRITFMADFMESLYHENREAVHYIADEVHTIAPTQTRDRGGDAARCLGAMEDLILQGRARGVGVTAISQRPAMVNTSVRTQCSSLIAMGMSGPHDIKAVMEWVEVHADEEQAAEMLASLPTLPIGEAWFWSPSAFEIFKRVKFRPRETFDSSRTPKVGEARRVPKVLATPDLDKLGADIKATVEQAKANDPAALKRRILELEKQIKDHPTAAAPAPKVIEKKIVTDAQVKRVESVVTRLEKEGQKRIEAAAKMEATDRELIQTAQALSAALAKASGAVSPVAPVVRPPVIQRQIVRPAPSARVAPVSGDGDLVGRDELTPSEKAVLDAAASFPGGASRQRISIYSGRSIKSSSFQSCFSGGDPKGERPSLVQRGLLREVGDKYEVTEAGMDLANPTAGVSLEDWLSKVTPSESKVLKYLADNYPRRLTREEVSAGTGQSMASSSFQSAFPQLRDLGLIEGKSDFTAASQLFDQMHV